MDPITYFIQLITNLENLNALIQTYDTLIYLILFLIIFCETGLVVFPFLPGDSILFAAGTFAASGSLELLLLLIPLSIAAVLGDTVNYEIGRFIGPRAFKGNIRFLKKEYLDRAHEFYEKYGRETIIIARFIPIIRTFAPFVAGIGGMRYLSFLSYNIIGGIAWVTLFVMGGYLFGNIPVVKENFTYVIIGIILVSFMPALVSFLRERFKDNNRSSSPKSP